MITIKTTINGHEFELPVIEGVGVLRDSNLFTYKITTHDGWEETIVTSETGETFRATRNLEHGEPTNE